MFCDILGWDIFLSRGHLKNTNRRMRIESVVIQETGDVVVVVVIVVAAAAVAANKGWWSMVR